MDQTLKTKAELEAMDKDTLTTYAAEEFGISLDKRKTLSGMLEMFYEGGGKSAEDAPPKPPAGGDDQKPPAAGAGDAGDTQKPPGTPPKQEEDNSGTELAKKAEALAKAPRYWVTIHADGGPAGNKDVKISVNGRAILVQRGKKVPLSKPYIHVLENAIQTIYEKDENDKMVGRDVPRHAFTVHGPVEN